MNTLYIGDIYIFMKLIHHHSSCVIQWEHHAGKQQSNLTTKQMTKIKTNKRNNVEMMMTSLLIRPILRSPQCPVAT